jgi:hypothetical protein
MFNPSVTLSKPCHQQAQPNAQRTTKKRVWLMLPLLEVALVVEVVIEWERWEIILICHRQEIIKCKAEREENIKAEIEIAHNRVCGVRIKKHWDRMWGRKLMGHAYAKRFHHQMQSNLNTTCKYTSHHN